MPRRSIHRGYGAQPAPSAGPDFFFQRRCTGGVTVNGTASVTTHGRRSTPGSEPDLVGRTEGPMRSYFATHAFPAKAGTNKCIRWDGRKDASRRGKGACGDSRSRASARTCTAGGSAGTVPAYHSDAAMTAFGKGGPGIFTPRRRERRARVSP